jgi:hypothetical protein
MQNHEHHPDRETRIDDVAGVPRTSVTMMLSATSAGGVSPPATAPVQGTAYSYSLPRTSLDPEDSRRSSSSSRIAPPSRRLRWVVDDIELPRENPSSRQARSVCGGLVRFHIVADQPEEGARPEIVQVGGFEWNDERNLDERVPAGAQAVGSFVYHSE